MRKKVIRHIKDTFTIRELGASDPVLRLICFPHAGGHSSIFTPLARYLPENWQICAIDPPGHGLARGHLIRQINALISLYSQSLLPWFDCPYCFLGHSFGGIVAYCLTLHLEKKSIKKPEQLFISASVPPEKMNETIGYSEHDAEHYVRELAGSYGLGDQNLSRSPFFVFYLPQFYADFRIVQSIQLTQTEKINTPASILYSHADEIFNSRDVQSWQQYLQIVRFYTVPGNHNYIHTQPQAVIKIICQEAAGFIKR